MAFFTVSSGGVPAGSYTGTFSGIDVQPENKERGYGCGLRWKFAIDAGPHCGQTASRITGTTPSPTNMCGKILSGLIGRPIREGEQIDPDPFRGKRYMIVVAPGREGSTRVEAIVPIPAA